MDKTKIWDIKGIPVYTWPDKNVLFYEFFLNGKHFTTDTNKLDLGKSAMKERVELTIRNELGEFKHYDRKT